MTISNNILNFILILFIFIIAIKLYLESDTFNLRCIISSKNGNKYCVRDRNKLHLAADRLELVGNAKFDSKSQSLRANVIYYDINTRSMKTKGSRVKFISESQN